MSNRFAAGKRALGLCDVCGFQYKLSKLRTTVRKGKDTNLLSCPTCWDPDHPQLQLGSRPVYDPQALRNPRPDTAELAQVRAIIVPVTPVSTGVWVGSVMVTV